MGIRDQRGSNVESTPLLTVGFPDNPLLGDCANNNPKRKKAPVSGGSFD
jgi:hypothetical protein